MTRAVQACGIVGAGLAIGLGATGGGHGCARIPGRQLLAPGRRKLHVRALAAGDAADDPAGDPADHFGACSGVARREHGRRCLPRGRRRRGVGERRDRRWLGVRPGPIGPALGADGPVKRGEQHPERPHERLREHAGSSRRGPVPAGRRIGEHGPDRWRCRGVGERRQLRWAAVRHGAERGDPARFRPAGQCTVRPARRGWSPLPSSGCFATPPAPAGVPSLPGGGSATVDVSGGGGACR